MQHRHLETTHSTNSQLIDWIVSSFVQKNQQIDCSLPYLLTADSQSHGRGQHQRTWQSPKGNVYFSLYIPVKKISKSAFIQPPLDGRLSLCISLNLLKMPILQLFNQSLQTAKQQAIGLKWVNDLGFYDGAVFQKLSGILIEPVLVKGEMLGVVIGIGLNVFATPVLTAKTQENLNYQAISLSSLYSQLQNTFQSVPKIPDLAEIYQQMTTACLQAVSQFHSFGQTVENHQENLTNFLAEFAQFDVLIGKNLQITLPTGEQKYGQACGVDKHGCLLLTTQNGIEPIWNGTIAIATE